MKKILIFVFFVSFNITAADHNEDQAPINNYMLLSTYEISAGQNPAELEKELVQSGFDPEISEWENPPRTT